jgi:hypothetical protein
MGLACHGPATTNDADTVYDIYTTKRGAGRGYLPVLLQVLILMLIQIDWEAKAYVMGMRALLLGCPKLSYSY